MEADPEAAGTVRENLAHCRLEQRGEVVVRAVEAFLAAPGPQDAPYDLVFADPPYGRGAELPWLAALTPPLVSPAGVIVIEHAARIPLKEAPGRLDRVDQRSYGQTALTFYRPAVT